MSEESPGKVAEDGDNIAGEPPFHDALHKELESEKQKSAECEDKLKRAMADYQNLSRKTKADIENGINARIDEFALDFLKIYDDFLRAREVFSASKSDIAGLDSILKNMDSLLQKHDISPINALDGPFDPNLHEAISVTVDPELEDGTVVKEIRKGYISQKRLIRATLVEISKKE